VKLLGIGVIISLLSLALLASACGGSKSSGSRLDPAKIPTATMPAQMPEALIIEGAPTRASRPSGRTYTVESGDTLSAIASRLGTTVEALMSLNGLTSTDLAVGQVLSVPGGDSVSAASPTPKPRETATPKPTQQPETADTPVAGATPLEGQTEYVVQSGDNANDIALRFGVTVEELAAANNTTVDALRSLQVGDVLIIPAASATPVADATEETPAETPAPE
jgi:LysM repeat protein